MNGFLGTPQQHPARPNFFSAPYQHQHQQQQQQPPYQQQAYPANANGHPHGPQPNGQHYPHQLNGHSQQGPQPNGQQYAHQVNGQQYAHQANGQHYPHQANGQANAPPAPEIKGVALRLKWAPIALVVFILYTGILPAYVAIRIIDTVLGFNDSWAHRGYSFFILCVELVGASALWPYAAANIRAVLPAKDPRKWSAQAPEEKYREFGCVTPFDVFVLVPCYKESWTTIKRTLMCALFARVPPNCRKHVILCDDGWDVQDNPNCTERGPLVQRLAQTMQEMYEGSRPPWFYTIHVSRRDKYQRNEAGQIRIGASKKPRRMAGNDKSMNLNHCIKNMVPRILFQYSEGEQRRGFTLGEYSTERLRRCIVTVFDADQAVNNDSNEAQFFGDGNRPPRNGDGLGFFPKILRVLEDPSLGLVLTPQTFTNVESHADTFNHLNPQFWEYILPGLTAMGYVACTGTNMGLRLSMLHAHSRSYSPPLTQYPRTELQSQSSRVWSRNSRDEQSEGSRQYEASLRGPFPTYSITEDYALSLELKRAGQKGTYISEHLVRGLAPEGITAVDRQRGRWTQGHWQIFFSLRNPLFAPSQLGVRGVLYYNYGTWAYLCNILTIWVFQCIPLLSSLGIQPVNFTERFRYVATIYLISIFLCQYYVREGSHLLGMWRANQSNILLCWTHMKAIGRAFIRRKTPFRASAIDEDAPTDEVVANPPMPEPPSSNLVNEKLTDIAGHVVHHALLLTISIATIAICIASTVRAHAMHSRFLLPAAWALFNAVGPVLFFCSAVAKKRATLEVWTTCLFMMHGFVGVVALASLWFINSPLTIGYFAYDTSETDGAP